MPRRHPGSASLLAGGLVGLLGVLTACGGGSTAAVTPHDRDCSALTSATVQLRLLDPRFIKHKQVQDEVAAVERLANIGDALRTPQIRALHALVTPVATQYVAALRIGNHERAIALEGTLRRKAVPIARACGLQPAQVYGLPTNR